jgi:hypothetical protein
MFDVFYIGNKPNLFAFEQSADSLEDAAKKSRTKLYWYIYGGNDYTNFDFAWRPAPWEEHQTHCFGTQWQRTGGAYLANQDTVHNKEWNFRTEQKVTRLIDKSNWIVTGNADDSVFDYSWHPDDLEEPYEYHFPTQWQRDGGPIYKGTAGIKYVDDQRIKKGATQIFYMDFLNEGSQEQFEKIKKQYPDAKLTRYVDSHLNVFKRIANLATTEYVWIVSSFCMYADFDFTWHPAPEQQEMIHVFPTCYYIKQNTQKRGDTFYIHVPSLRTQLYELELLDWFNVINYCTDQTVPVIIPVVEYHGDSMVESVVNHEFCFPYTIFKKDIFPARPLVVPPCLWHPKDRVIEALNFAGSVTIVPREARAHVKTQLYDYPYVSRRKDSSIMADKALDIVYISNGEPDAERWYNHLVTVAEAQIPHGLQKIHRVKNVNGRIAAYHAAAQASNTDWFFAVFAKLEVVGSFNFGWQPDYWQEAKHYIFHSRNCLNGLEYGHMGVIAYNKRLVLETVNSGLDFTLTQKHTVVPELSAIAYFNQDPWTTWRTAFREVLKLKLFMEQSPTLETEHRLDTWLTTANGDYSEWCLRGAQDAVDYYTEVAGEYNKLMLSFDWPWLDARFKNLYNV